MTIADNDDRQARVIGRLVKSFYTRDSYGLVLAMIVVTYVLSISATEDWIPSVVLAVQIATVWLALHTSEARRRLRVVANVLLGLAAGVAVAHLFAHDADGLVAALFLFSSLLYFIAPLSIVRHIGFRAAVDRETMLGAVSAYLFIGMAFAFCYRTLGVIGSEPFFGTTGEDKVSNDLFFSFVTLTTTGYGDLVPATTAGQGLAVFEALLGQLFLVTAVAKVVNAWRPRVWRQAAAGGAEGGESVPS
jgi:hypothetical protein